jgi:hypothetical protein
MPGLVPGIHVFLANKQDVDGRDKPGHDDLIHNTSRGCVSASSGQIGRMTRRHGSLR